MEDIDPQLSREISKKIEAIQGKPISDQEVGEVVTKIPEALKAEREKYLEMVRNVRGAPAFVIEFKPGNSERFTKEEIFKSLQIGDEIMGDDRGAVVQYHREGDSYHVTGVLLHKSAMERFVELIESGELNATVALSIPEAGDVQNITLSRDKKDFTVYGSSVLALFRGRKQETKVAEDLPVYQLAPDDEDAIMAAKQTPLKELRLSEIQFDWPTDEDLAKANLPESLFQKRNPDNADRIDVITIDTEQMAIIKPDINDSGEKILGQKLSDSASLEEERQIRENRALIVAANFHLLNSFKETVEIFNPQAKEASHTEERKKAIVLSTLGDSALFALERQRAGETTDVKNYYRRVVKEFAEHDTPDMFDFNREPLDREEKLGHLTNIEMPIAGEINIFVVNGEVVGFDRTWDPNLESELENYHKANNLRPSTILTEKMMNDNYQEKDEV